MLDLREAVKLARNRVTTRHQTAEAQKSGLPSSTAIVEQGSSFRVRLTDALRKGSGDERKRPSEAPTALFLACPEKLLAKWYYLAFGPQRAKTAADRPTAPPDWREWDNLGEHCSFVNFGRRKPRAVMVAHGLSAIDDSVLLLADLGRAFRAAWALRVPVRVLLAGVNWISHNRSLSQFDLTDELIENGLRFCQDRRTRLYEAVGAEVKIHEVVGYAKKGVISNAKIHMIANRYIELASFLWGADKINTDQPLQNPAVALIGKNLAHSVDDRSPLHVLKGFPGALNNLEKALAPHLDVIRTVAQRFRILSLDTFSYVFAQYYAQDRYRGTHVKVAPLSERSFDEPFDKLDESFRSWGEGHEPGVREKDDKRKFSKRLTAVYLPQYHIGDWELLPYSPLSLSGVTHSGGKIGTVKDRVILLSDCSLGQLGKVEALLQNTMAKKGAARLNRLIYDVLSFLQASIRAPGVSPVHAVGAKLGISLSEVLRILDNDLPEFFSVECEESAVPPDMWLSWLDAIERDSAPKYVPCHLLLACFSESEWTQERFSAAARLIIIANALACELSA
jgi:hypothetical protein